MDTSKLNNKAIAAGILILIYGVLYIPLMYLNYMPTGDPLRFLATPTVLLWALMPIVAAATLFVRNRIIAAVGLGLWAAYQIFSLVTSCVNIIGMNSKNNPDMLGNTISAYMPSWIASGILIVALVLIAVSIAVSGKGGSTGKILRGVAIGFVVLWWLINVGLGVRSLLSYASSMTINPELVAQHIGTLVVGQLRSLLAAVGLLMAALSGSQKQPAAVASQQPYGMPAAQYAPAAYGQAPYGQPADAYGQQQFGQPVGAYSQAHCPACGADIDANMAFCRMCGQPLNGSGQSQLGQQQY